MADMYELKLTAKFEGDIYTKMDELDFTVLLVDPCLDAQLTIASEILESTEIVYPIYKPAET